MQEDKDNDKAGDTARQTDKTLRQRAEEMVRVSPDDLSSMSVQDIQRLVYELQIHQVEMELQNEELREAQMDLAASRDRFADLYDFAPVGYLTLDDAGIIVDANLAAAALLGVERSKLPGLKFSRFVAPDNQDIAHLYWQRVFGTPQRQVCELAMRGGNDQPIYARLESIAVENQHAPSRQCRVALIDIAELRQEQQTLHTLNATLEQRVATQVGEMGLMAKAIANLGEGVLITTDHRDWLASSIVSANNALCDMLGFSLEDLLDQSPESFLGERIDPSQRLQLQQQVSANQTFLGELVYTAKNGKSLNIELLISPILNRDKQRINYVAIVRDVTERKRAEQLLYNREQRLQAILDTVPDGIITIDLEGIVQDCNPAAERLFGFPPAEMLGQNVSMLMPSPYREEHDGYLRRYRETGEAHIIRSTRQLIGQHRDGRQFPVTLSVNEIDHLGLYLGVIQDVSELRQLQREVLGAADGVQVKIGQALHDGPQQALAGLKLLSRGLAQDLQRIDSPLEPQARRISAGIKEANEAIRHLARGLVPVHIGSGGLLAALLRLASHTSENSGITCEVICPSPIRLWDNYTEDQLYHIAQEATLNAIKHSGGSRIRISLEREGTSLTLRVIDNGHGIGSDRAKGPGLGMYIMPYRAATLGASLTVSPAEGGGTSVCCTLTSLNISPPHPHCIAESRKPFRQTLPRE
jgi:PAS domain S-box-containing protein